MIHIFPASFGGQVTKIQARVLKFEVADENKELTKEIGNSSLGTHFLIVAYDVSDLGDVQTLQNDDKAARTLLMKRLHAKVGDYVSSTGVEKDVIMNVLRLKLEHRGIIKKSLSELDEQGVAKAIYVLDTEMHPDRFKYSEYA